MVINLQWGIVHTLYHPLAREGGGGGVKVTISIFCLDIWIVHVHTYNINGLKINEAKGLRKLDMEW